MNKYVTNYISEYANSLIIKVVVDVIATGSDEALHWRRANRSHLKYKRANVSFASASEASGDMSWRTICEEYMEKFTLKCDR